MKGSLYFSVSLLSLSFSFLSLIAQYRNNNDHLFNYAGIILNGGLYSLLQESIQLLERISHNQALRIVSFNVDISKSHFYSHFESFIPSSVQVNSQPSLYFDEDSLYNILCSSTDNPTEEEDPFCIYHRDIINKQRKGNDNNNNLINNNNNNSDEEEMPNCVIIGSTDRVFPVLLNNNNNNMEIIPLAYFVCMFYFIVLFFIYLFIYLFLISTFLYQTSKIPFLALYHNIHLHQFLLIIN